MFDPQVWAAVPFHFWSAVFFVFGSMVGSFLNVCIYRMPRNESIVSPGSHCPQCNYSIPWFLNIPIVTWLYLRGKCANCALPIPVRYVLVELLTGLVFLGCWLRFGHLSAPLALVYCVVLSGFIVATFIDVEHLIIPDEITLGGIVAGFVCSMLVPLLHRTSNLGESIRACMIGGAVGWGIVFLVLNGGKLLFGRQKIALPEDATIRFTETELILPDHPVPYEEIFARKTDTVRFHASRLILPDRCFFNTPVALKLGELKIGEEILNPDEIKEMEASTREILLPREAMGFGDVKFMAAIGAFLGWQATVFTLMASSVLGTLIALLAVILGRKEFSGRIPFGPYIAAAAVIWIFMPWPWQAEWKAYLNLFGNAFHR
jgi:leader peptidase (prepilin peptidase)/N-methyltransferase